MNIATTANIILTLLPIVSDTVKNVEAAVGSGNGSSKLKLALDIIKPIYDASSPVVPFESLVGQVTSVIAALVTFYQSIQAFTRSVTKQAA